ncbi:hypothetical protein EMIHUDRAFT_243301 [Emiliania huxleyi CCMP1516]|uniref:J domain-containing protein n=2 Tax=Emiliania huxleyi TaxID=2903 RepID=A0A0D3J6E0_EMIH1|nr:hypothetical protein EMIHUDRAFT_243301 [Emiliania huxleyi CCMP1516]EOD19075.1 hypothetical protein EMIHUDRAFT_243301 [Emiliania huxleyi CCMP1516]|eukprot:XP_005771504.1 hypothetical protein EMIHUDRAFT_243301 [Emiliania huxleyi CCMP1516]
MLLGLRCLSLQFTSPCARFCVATFISGSKFSSIKILAKKRPFVSYYKIFVFVFCFLEASHEACRKRYLALALRVHPDKTSEPRAQEAFKALEAAFRSIPVP